MSWYIFPSIRTFLSEFTLLYFLDLYHIWLFCLNMNVHCISHLKAALYKFSLCPQSCLGAPTVICYLQIQLGSIYLSELEEMNRSPMGTTVHSENPFQINDCLFKKLLRTLATSYHIHVIYFSAFFYWTFSRFLNLGLFIVRMIRITISNTQYKMYPMTWSTLRFCLLRNNC